jgi:SAM-dependent methyltransferase
VAIPDLLPYDRSQTGAVAKDGSFSMFSLNFKRGAKSDPQMRARDAKASLLQELNADIPKDLDWTAGAISYVAAESAKHGEEGYTRYMLSKPLAPIPAAGPEAAKTGGAALIENCAYLTNFINAAALLDLPGRSHILDVACGSGWVAQFFTRMNYVAYGLDVSPDMIELARRRFGDDPLLDNLSEEIRNERLFVLDVERAPLPERLHGMFDAIILESCLHHFIDPISALEHLTRGLTEDGVVVVIEGENRSGPIKQEYLDVMKEFATLERPYTRNQLERILDCVGLPAREFLGRLNGWFSPRDPRVANLTEMLRGDADAINFVVAAKKTSPLDRIFSFRKSIEG